MSGRSDIREEFQQAAKDGAKFVTSTFVSSFAESVAFYTVAFIGGGVILYYSGWLMKRKFDGLVAGARDKMKESSEKVEKRVENVLDDERLQSAMRKGNVILKDIEHNVNEIDIPDIVDKLKHNEKLNEILEKGNSLGKKINDLQDSDNFDKIRSWRLKVFGKKDSQQPQQDNSCEAGTASVIVKKTVE